MAVRPCLDQTQRGRAVRLVLVAALLAALAPFATARPLAAAGLVFGDDFESGTLAAWTVRTAGSGTAGAQGSVTAGGAYAARLSASGSGSYAYARVPLGSSLQDLTVTLDVNVLAGGAKGNNVPLVRMFSATGTRLISLYRQNVNSGKLYVQVGSSAPGTSGKLAIGAWATVQVSVQATGTTSSVTVALNGQTIYAGTGLVLGAPVAAVQIGSDTLAQAFDLAADNVTVTADDPLATPSPSPSDSPTPSPSPSDSPTPSPTPSPSPSPTPSPSPSPSPSGSPPPAGILFLDDFETGQTSAWSIVRVAGTGTAVVQTAIVAAGTYSARLASSGTSSYAYLRQALAVPQAEISVRLSVNVLAEGASGSNVPLLRLFDANGTRLVSLYRQNVAGNKVYVHHSGTWNLTSALAPLGTWSQVELRVVAGGTGASTVEVRFGGTLVYQTSTASIANPVASFQVGNDTSGQAFDLVADDVLAVSGGSDTIAPETTIDSGPTGTVASTSATFSFSSSEAGSTFSCRLDGSTWAACTSPHQLSSLANGAHTFDVRATDAGGLTDPSPASRTWTVSVTSSCDPSLAAPSNSDPGTVVIADNFEHGLGDWTRVTAEGDGAAATQTSNVKSGRCSLRIHVTNLVWDSRANLTESLPAGTRELWATGWFNTETQGVDQGWNTPTFRVLSNGKRVFDLSRQNQTGNLFVRWPSRVPREWTLLQTGRTIALNRWYEVKVHLVANDNISTVEVWLDGTRVFQTNEATLGVDRLDVLMVGAEHQNQEGDIAVDDVVVKAVAAPDPSTVFADGFEQGLLAWDAVVTGGDGSVTPETAIVRSGNRAARLTASTTTGSLAHLRQDLAQSETDLTVALDVYVDTEGSNTTYLPVVALSDAGGSNVATVWRRSQLGTLSVQYAGASYNVAGTLPTRTWTRVGLQVIARPGATSTVIVTLDGAQAYRADNAAVGALGVKALRTGSSAGGAAYSWVVDGVTAVRGIAGYKDGPAHKLLIADHLSRRLLITDFYGRVIWSFENPTGRLESDSGPIGVRWMPNNQILATFGTGEVGLIDVATRQWVWRTSGYNGDWFQSPYDAEVLPDGNLAVAMRFNNGGRISVYNRATGEEVWRHYLSNAHSVHFRTAAQSYASDDPTLLVGGWGSIREVAYRTNGGQNVTWQVRTEYTHDAIVVENDLILTSEGYYIQKINRSGTQLWRRSTPDEDRRIAVNPNPIGGYLYTVAESDRVEFRDINGNLIRDWAMLSDGTSLDFPYGVQVIDYPG